MSPVIQLRSAGRVFVRGSVRTDALRPVDLEIGAGQLVAVTGRSGSGKSTLLNVICGIDRPSSGHVLVAGQDLGALGESDLSSFRGRTIGIVFQFFELIPTLSALDNVMLAMDLVGSVPRGRRRARAIDLLKTLGVDRQANKPPTRLSGGEQQRVAIARALANDPPVLVADEPAGNLDSANAAVIAGVFRDLARQGRTVVVATHEQAGLERYDRVLRLEDGVMSEPAAEARP